MIDEILDMAGVKDLSRFNDVMITVLGTKRIVVTNIGGVMELSDSEIVLNVNNSQKLLIVGEYLAVKEMNKNEIVVDGRILKIEFLRV